MSVESASKILIVDDDPAMRRLIAALLRRDYQIQEVASGEEALANVAAWGPALVLLDIMMPGIDGYETCRRIKAGLGADLQVVMVSGKSSRDEQLRAYEVGADDYLTKPFDRQDLLARVRLHLQLRDAKAHVGGIQAEIESRNFALHQIAEQRAQEIMDTQDVAVFTLAKIAESRDEDTGAHVYRMRAYAQLLAEELARGGPYASQIDRHFLEDLYRSTPLHDIGKVGIRDDILLKPGRLTAEEFEIMKRHTVIGADVLDEAVRRSKGGGFLAMAALIARYHHERFNGTGYPAGLAGLAIPLPARIVALADVYDALTSVRPYKPAYSPGRARGMIEVECGHHFDPVVVAAFHKQFANFLAVQAKACDDSPRLPEIASELVTALENSPA